MAEYYLGIDIGTSSTKAALIDCEGKIYGIGQREYTISMPKAGWSEQHPDVWWNSVVESVRSALAISGVGCEEISAIGLSGQMHGIVVLDAGGKVLRPAIIWSDQRSSGQVQRYEEYFGKKRLGELCANPVATGFAGPSFLWLKENEPDIYNKTQVVIQPKDYVRYKMTGLIATEITDACGTLLFNTAKGKWSKEVCNDLGLDINKLPEVFKPWEKAGTLTDCAAEQLGLRPGITVAYGGADQPMQAIGNGIIQSGTVSVTIGTGGQVFTPIHEPKYDPELRMHTFSHAIENTWNVLGATLSAGLSLKWFRHEIIGEIDYKELDISASNIRAGSEGLIFLPYLVGERTPYMDSKARGAFIGLTLRHTRAHMIRAVMEGVTMALWQSLSIFKELSLPVDLIIASGGGASSSLWRQIMADILECPISITAATEQACVGAAIMGSVAHGAFDSVQSAVEKIVPPPTILEHPNAEQVKRYRKVKEIFVQAYLQNKSIMHALSCE